MRRFTIGRLMLAVGASALVVLPLRSVDWGHGPHRVVLLQMGTLLGGLIGLAVAFGVGRSRPRWARALFGATSLLWTGATGLILTYLVSIAGIVLLMLTTLLLSPVALGAGLGWVVSPACPSVVESVQPGSRPRPRRWFRALLVLAALGLPVGLMVTLAPLHLAFALSRPALERLADRIAAGGTLNGPEWAGCYRVVAAQASPLSGNVALIIDADPSGRSAFTRVRNPNQTGHPLYNFNFNVALGDLWFYQNED